MKYTKTLKPISSYPLVAMGNTVGKDQVGYRVLGVQPDSPAEKVGLVSFFDFIVAANGVPFTEHDDTFVTLIKESEDKPLPLTIYNCKCHSTREVTLVPSNKWPGDGMLGVKIRFDTYMNAEECLCRVLDVSTNSPAELAGLKSGTDFLLGTATSVFSNTGVLADELERNIDNPVEFYVYDSATDTVRVVVVMPSDDWGGEGLLGADAAHGYLHRLPSHCMTTIGSSKHGGSDGTDVGDPGTGGNGSKGESGEAVAHGGGQ